MFNPREAALNSLLKWDLSGAFSNIEINTVISRVNAKGEDISLYTFLYLGVIEKKMLLDSVIKKYSKIPVEDIDVQALNILRLGIYQLAFADRIPDYSAVDESVSLAPKKAKGFVNAILRSFIRDSKKIDLPEEKWQKISLESSIPMELIGIFTDSYGSEIAEKICTYISPKSYTCLRINTLKATENEVISKIKGCGYSAEKSEIATDLVKTDAPISAIKEMLDLGLIFVQDESSKIASMVVNAQPGDIIADVCACPGGKSFSIAIDMQNKGELYSSDLHENKLNLINKGASRLGIDIIKTKEQNAKVFVSEYEEKFDRVLVDVPCSGLGLIFKKPDIKYKSIDSINALPSVQYDILNNVKNYVKKGGVLVYSTCTINAEENEKNVERFLAENKNFYAYDYDFGTIKSTKGGYTFLPHVTGTDGFFVARMKKKDE